MRANWRARAVLTTAFALLVVACNGDEPRRARSTTTTTAAPATTSTTAGPERIEVTVAGGQVVGGVRTEEVSLGERVTIAVTSDIAEEVHLHGYDVKVNVAPGSPAALTFTADIPGVFEVELEHARLRILEIAVR